VYSIEVCYIPWLSCGKKQDKATLTPPKSKSIYRSWTIADMLISEGTLPEQNTPINFFKELIWGGMGWDGVLVQHYN